MKMCLSFECVDGGMSAIYMIKCKVNEIMRFGFLVMCECVKQNAIKQVQAFSQTKNYGIFA